MNVKVCKFDQENVLNVSTIKALNAVKLQKIVRNVTFTLFALSNQKLDKEM